MERLSNNQIFQYNGSPITFQKGDSVMVNATQMAKPFGKEPKFWLMNQSTTDYLNELSKVRNLTLTDLVQVTKGGNNPGTWMHEDVAMEFARWLSPAFAIWCNDRIKELLTIGMTATQPTLEQMIDNPDLVIQLATQLKREREEKEKLRIENESQQHKIAIDAPKVEFYDEVVDSKDALPMDRVAKLLNIGIGRNRLFAFLREKKVLMPNNTPYQKYVELGWLRCVESKFSKPNGDTCINIKTVVLQKGLDGIRKMFNNKK
jgi:phage antirepressor YoqD-like protein|nr:MAG TPA: KilA protein [Caudoviricetes sp.]